MLKYLIATAILSLTLNFSASAGTIYTWVTVDGTRAFTDDLKRIPFIYEVRAKGMEVNGLNGYPKYTPVPESDYHERLKARLEYLREKRSR